MSTTNARLHIIDENGNAYDVHQQTSISDVEGLQAALNAKANSSDVTSGLAGKVDKETGKGLSTNDYTTTEKNKLAGIEAQANKTVVDAALSATSTNPVQNKVVKAALDEQNSSFIEIKAFVTPEMFGAVGDGINDDTAAIRSALSSDSSNVFLSKVYAIRSDISTNGKNIFGGGTLKLEANITLGNYSQISDLNIFCDGGSIVVSGKAIRIINNSFLAHEDSESANVCINIIRSNDLKIALNSFACDGTVLANQKNIAIQYIQGSENEFMNSVISENFFSIFAYHIKVVCNDDTRFPYCAGVRVSNNTFISSYYSISLECSDHWRIIDNIIDYSEHPLILKNPNGIRITGNYIFSPVANVSNVQIQKTGFCEDVLIKNNYIWNNEPNRTGTVGIKIYGNAMEGLIIDSNFLRFFNKCISLENDLNAVTISNNTFMESVYSGSADGTITRGVFSGNNTMENTSYEFTDADKFDSPTRITTGSFIAAVADNSYTDVRINYNAKTVAPVILISPQNNEAIENFTWMIKSSNASTAEIRIYKKGTGYAVDLEYRWAVIG